MSTKAVLIFILLASVFAAPSVLGQGKRGNDTTYYVYFPESITGRYYFSQKYTSFYIKSKTSRDLHYTPNTTLNMGVGATYHNFSLNLAYGFGFLNQDDDKGKTKYLDLQGHFYAPKWVTDFYGQFYTGYHLAPEGFAAAPNTNYYYRPDMKVTLAGLSQYRVFNNKKFSFRAAFIQNEWQKKSAGTLLAGAEMYYGVVRADSSLVPKSIGNNYTQDGIDKINYFSIGPGIGYAYTAVAFQHLFITGSLTGNVNFSFATEHTGNDAGNKFSLNLDTRFRLAAGYNSRTWNVSANWIADGLTFSGKKTDDKYAFHTGNYRFILSKKFATGERLKKKLKPLDFIFKE
jgi:hypothetical protein